MLKPIGILIAILLSVNVTMSATTRIETSSLVLELDQSGNVIVLQDKKENVNYVVQGKSSPLLRIMVDGVYYNPSSLTVKGNKLKLDFTPQKTSVTIAYEVKSSYISFCVDKIVSKETVELVSWGPYRVTLADKIGKSIGLAYDDNYAIGLMGLNLKSCGGFELVKRERFGNTAQRNDEGALLQGFTRNRNQTRMDDNCLQELTEAVPVKGKEGSIVGSKFALYGVPTSDLKKVIAQIEKAEGLPYITHNGVWQKESIYSTSSKFIMSYNLDNIEACLDVAEQAGITCVYHPGIFESWGTYPVKKKDFPEGYKSVSECAKKARSRGITLGAHTLSNFLTKDDPLVAPIPSPHLQMAGITSLKTDISADSKSIELKDPSVRIAYDKDDLNVSDEKLKEFENKNRESFAVLIDEEIIEYSFVEKGDKLILKECERGAFGTHKASHKAGAKVGRLVSHYYKVFFADIQLQDEVAKNLAHFFNETGLERISFDGIEGGLAAGHGRYGCDRFIKVFYDHLKNKNIIANSSDVMHYAWHYLSNESWGEPWWAKSFRESQLDHRLRVQKDLEEDLLPRKMGQFRITSKTTLKDIEWVMGLCAGYDAGIDFYISPQEIKKNPKGDRILEEVKKWETVRMTQVLSEEQKKQLRDPLSSYKLQIKDGKAELIFIESWVPSTGKIQKDNDRNTLAKHVLEPTKEEIFSLDYSHVNMQKEPGQPTEASWTYYCVGKQQPLQFVIRVPKHEKESVKGIYLQLGATKCELPIVLKPGEYVISRGNNRIVHYSTEGKEIETKQINDLTVTHGKNTILFDYKGKGRIAGPKVMTNFISKK